MSFHLKCRSCGSTAAALILDLGQQPLANNLLAPADLAKPEPKFPLRLAVCKSCWLLQITDLVPPVELFSEYLYFSSFSDLMLRHAREAAEGYIAKFGLNPQSLVVEIASNDGYLLQNFVKAGIPCLGIEPAANIAKVAREKGVSAYVGEGSNRWAAAHVGDVARLYRLAIEHNAAGARYHAVGETGVPVRDIAQAIGRGLKIPVVSLAPEEAAAHFGFLGSFAGSDLCASSEKTRRTLGWIPTGPGLISDLENMDYS